MTEFYRQYLAVAVFVVAAFAMVGAMLTVARILRPTLPQPEKYITYESGSDPLPLFGQANVRYYIYALLFVIFDVEERSAAIRAAAAREPGPRSGTEVLLPFGVHRPGRGLPVGGCWSSGYKAQREKPVAHFSLAKSPRVYSAAIPPRPGPGAAS